MKKKIIGISLAVVLSQSLLFASEIAKNDSPKRMGASFEYDAVKGWWWYKEKYKDKDGKEFEVKQKLTPKEKTQREIEQAKIRLMKSQNAKLEVIKERLEYAYPNIVPKYTINKKTGKKCLSNSSSDCFVMPLQAEAQHTPVLAKWLTNPSPKNSKEWLKWQAKYFNHLTNIGYGNKFAYLSGGSKVYPTDNYFNSGDSVSISKTRIWEHTNRMNILLSLKDKVELFFMYGETPVLEAVSDVKNLFRIWGYGRNNQIHKKFVFKSIKDLERINKDISLLAMPESKKVWEKIKKNNDFIINPSLFKRFNIEITPTIVAVYKKDAKKTKTQDYVWQKISTGPTSIEEIVQHTIQFLVYNKIIDPKDLSNNTAIENGIVKKDFKVNVNEKDIHKSTNIIHMSK